MAGWRACVGLRASAVETPAVLTCKHPTPEALLQLRHQPADDATTHRETRSQCCIGRTATLLSSAVCQQHHNATTTHTSQAWWPGCSHESPPPFMLWAGRRSDVNLNARTAPPHASSTAAAAGDAWPSSTSIIVLRLALLLLTACASERCWFVETDLVLGCTVKSLLGSHYQ